MELKKNLCGTSIMDMDSTTSSPFKGVEVIRRFASGLTTSAGVYRMISEKGEVLYVGKARNLKNRVSHYTNISQLPIRLQRMVHITHSMEVVTTASEAQALLLESNMIKHYQPRYNILLKDDKSYPYIHISGDHPYPRISMHRGPREAPGEYLGPFTSAAAVHETITFLQRAFLLRPCSDNYFAGRQRPCLQYQIKRCSAPCVGLIGEAEYNGLIRQARDFLSGKSSEIQQELASQMQAHSDNMEFEKAALLRDRIRAFAFVRQQMQYAADLGDTDVITIACEARHCCVQVFAFRAGRNYGNQIYFPQHTEGSDKGEILQAFLAQYYARQQPPEQILLNARLPEEALMSEALALRAGRKVELLYPQRGEKRKAIENALSNTKDALTRYLSERAVQEELLDGVAQLFGLKAAPERIEVYDNSHIMGTDAVGGMVVAGKEGFIKSAYRKFTIKNTALTPGDDYGMMREVLTRRFKRLGADDWDSRACPDIILIDGGAGQLSVAVEVLQSLGIEGVTPVAISKGPDRNAGREWFHMPGKTPFQLPPNDPVLHYLQRLRDEVHRFAIGFHRNKRSKGMRRSELDSIPSIGAARKKALLHHFGSARAVAGASVEEIRQVSGINLELAQKIYAHFH